MNGDRIKSDHSEIQPPVKKALDVVKITVHQTTDRPNLSVDNINRINQDISKFIEKSASYGSKIMKSNDNLQTSFDQLAQWKEQVKQHQAVYNESNYRLIRYEALLQKSGQKCLNDINDNKVNALLEGFHDVQQKTVDLTKEQDKHRQEIQKELGKLLKFSQRLDEGEERLKDLTAKLSLLQKQMQKDLFENQPLLDEGEERHTLTEGLGELLKFSQLLDEGEKRRNALLHEWEEKIRQAPLTPTDELFGQYKQHKLAYEKVKAICDNVDKELKKYRPGTTPRAQKSETASLPEVTQIDHLLSEVKQIQKLVDESSGCPHELQETVKALAETIEHFHQKATATQQMYEQIKIDAENIHQEQMRFHRLADRIGYYTCPEKYNPYYHIDRVHSKKSFLIDNTLPGSCAIMTTRRGLSKLGINIRSIATEKNVAQLVEYLGTEGGTVSNTIQKVYQHYGFDYRHYKGLVTIDEIERITQKRHVVHVGAYKPVIGGHSLLIEKITRTNDGYRVTFYDTYNDAIVTLPYGELEKVLTGRYTLPSKRQRETRKPILNAQAQTKAKTEMLWSILDYLGVRSTGRS